MIITIEVSKNGHPNFTNELFSLKQNCKSDSYTFVHNIQEGIRIFTKSTMTFPPFKIKVKCGNLKIENIHGNRYQFALV